MQIFIIIIIIYMVVGLRNISNTAVIIQIVQDQGWRKKKSQQWPHFFTITMPRSQHLFDSESVLSFNMKTLHSTCQDRTVSAKL